jgi:hypothetical protein
MVVAVICHGASDRNWRASRVPRVARGANTAGGSGIASGAGAGTTGDEGSADRGRIAIAVGSIRAGGRSAARVALIVSRARTAAAAGVASGAGAGASRSRAGYRHSVAVAVGCARAGTRNCRASWVVLIPRRAGVAGRTRKVCRAGARTPDRLIASDGGGIAAAVAGVRAWYGSASGVALVVGGADIAGGSGIPGSAGAAATGDECSTH